MSDDLNLIVKVGADASGIPGVLASAKASLQKFADDARAAVGASTAQMNAARAAAGGAGGKGGGSAADALLTRANFAIGIQAANAALLTTTSLTKAIKGDFEGAWSEIEKMPLGLGQVASSLMNIAREISGANAELAKFNEETKAQEERQKKSEGRVNSEITLKRLRAQADIDAASGGVTTDFDAKRKAMLAQATFENEQTRSNELRAGGERSLVEEAFKLREELDRKRIEKQIAEEKYAADAVASHKATLAAQQADTDKRLMQERLADAARQEDENRIKGIRKEIEDRRELVSSMREQLSDLKTPDGSDFLTRSSTALGSFSSGQAGAGQAVMAAAQKQVDLQTQIRDVAKSIDEGVKKIQSIQGAWT